MNKKDKYKSHKMKTNPGAKKSIFFPIILNELMKWKRKSGSEGIAKEKDYHDTNQPKASLPETLLDAQLWQEVKHLLAKCTVKLIMKQQECLNMAVVVQTGRHNKYATFVFTVWKHLGPYLWKFLYKISSSDGILRKFKDFSLKSRTRSY